MQERRHAAFQLAVTLSDGHKRECFSDFSKHPLVVLSKWAPRRPLPRALCWEFVSGSQLQHRMFDKLNRKNHSLKKGSETFILWLIFMGVWECLTSELYSYCKYWDWFIIFFPTRLDIWIQHLSFFILCECMSSINSRCVYLVWDEGWLYYSCSIHLTLRRVTRPQCQPELRLY